MRLVQAQVTVMVRFAPGEAPFPSGFFYQGRFYRIDAVLRRERSPAFRLPGWRYLVMHNGRYAELFWNIDRHTWTLIKLDR